MNRLLLLFFFTTITQQVILAQFDERNRSANRGGRELNTSTQSYNRLFEYEFVERKPIFMLGKDSLNELYIKHFSGFDSLIEKCVTKGDTAKYIRVHFEFVIDENGIPYDGKFTYVGSTRYRAAGGDKKIKYFDDVKDYLNRAVKKMISQIPAWKPAMQNGVRVNCIMADYFQLWLGINPER